MMSLLLVALTGFATFADSQATFHALFEREVGASVSDLHFLADSAVTEALAAPTLEQAMRAQAAGSLATLAPVKPSTTVAPAIPRAARPLTVVLVPGVFAEFIKTRAFAEVFEKPSSARDEYLRVIEREHATAEVTPLANWVPGVAIKTESRPFGDVMLMGEMQVGPNTVRVVLLATEFGTLESLGDARERARLFNSRLEKYLALTGDQDLAFIGYSRGTVLGLEMLAQAHAAGRPWVQDVRAMISLSGVTWGSSLADEATANPASPLYRVLAEMKTTLAALQLVDTNAPKWQWYETVKRNSGLWIRFFVEADRIAREMNADKTFPVGTILQVDPRSPVVIIGRMWQELGLLNWVFGYNDNIERFRYFVGELFAAFKELGTAARTEWWQTRTLPTGPTYYALAAAMADPNRPDPEPRLFANKRAYGDGSYDDVSLLENHRDYTRASGVALNDSQVSIAQAAFLPNVIARANPANAGLRTTFLGVADTHHWGLALREVNKMLLGQRNGYPREALLRALAAQVIVDGHPAH